MTHRIVILLPLIVLFSESSVSGQVPAGFQPHLQAVQGGEIDWARGVIIAHGTGEARGVTPREHQKAKRAGELVAARNVLALINGIRVDERGRFNNVKNAQIQLQGIVKNHRVVSSEWKPQATPPQCLVKLEVPIWGAKSISSIIYESHVRSIQVRTRITLAAADVNVANEILVIDARGTGVVPCLFPIVVGGDAGVLYDVSVLRRGRGVFIPPVRYVETRLTLEELRSALPAKVDPVRALASYAKGPSMTEWFDAQPASQPTSKPVAKPKKRRKRRVVKAVKAAGNKATRIALTQEDAKRLAGNAAGASLLRKGQVVVVVDSVAAGIQGRRDDLLDPVFVASVGDR